MFHSRSCGGDRYQRLAYVVVCVLPYTFIGARRKHSNKCIAYCSGLKSSAHLGGRCSILLYLTAGGDALYSVKNAPIPALLPLLTFFKHIFVFSPLLAAYCLLGV